MTDRDRLIELINNAPKTDTVYGDIKLKTPIQTVQTIADYLLANGVIVPPCKVGDTLYQIIDMSHTACKSFVSDFPIKVLPYQIYYINVMGGISAIPFDSFGKTVFLTKEEAKQAFAERSKG